MKVLKFGGSSVADATRMSGVLDIVCAAASGDRVILVCSAVSGCTDALIEISGCRDASLREEKIGKLRERHRRIALRLFTGAEREEALRELDSLFDELSAAPAADCVTFGELFSTRLIARKLQCEDFEVQWLDSRRLIRTVDGTVAEEASYAAILRSVSGSAARIFVAPGFIASDQSGHVTTLGRGGSDYSAALFAAGAKASSLEIWTDVPGIMTANPKVVPSAATVPEMSYASALALAENGAKVLYAPTVRPAMDAGIAINIRNTFEPRHPGTEVNARISTVRTWVGVTSASRGDRCTLCLVGERVDSRRSAAGRIESALREAGISPLGPVSGEGGVFFIDVRPAAEEAAVCAVHREFFESRAISTINVYIAGYGAVGKALAGFIDRSAQRIAAHNSRSLRIVGVSDSRHFCIDFKGLDSSAIARRLQAGDSAEDGAYMDAVCATAPRKAVFIDCTDSLSLYRRYEELFRAGLSIVTCNRRSLAVPYVQYAALKNFARENGAYFRYDTTVGTSLPILESIAGSANCSDGIESIEAVVSCTLNYIISSYDGDRSESFAALLRHAQDEGLTEPDPRFDLGGKDALRKLLILAREAGVPLEEEDVEITPMLGPDFFDCGIEEFYTRLAEYEPGFVQKEAELDAAGLRQRFIASLRKDPSSRLGYRAEIQMRLVGAESPFYWVSGTENVTVISTEYSAPLVIRGAGEGVEAAAIGIIKDILMQ